MPKKKTNKDKKYEKPLSFYPLKPEQVLKALLEGKPEKEEGKEKEA
ncbi:hypothetical protein JXM67_12025 [candidate division WOR-3 bacterium]|nr:hypothetical protein [candidate division WOR-3 bacterium]